MRIQPFSHILSSLFRIPNKEGEIVPFVLNEVQNKIHNVLVDENAKRLNILKFRQGGVTTLIMGFFLVECLTRYCTAVIIAHDKEHTEKLLQRCRLMLQLLKGPKPEIQRENISEIYFAKTHSTLYIGTAGSKNFGRSATITHLHCSEVAFWRDPAPLVAGLLQAVPKSGIVIFESTANGAGTWYHDQWIQSKQGKSSFRPLFLPWYLHSEYQIESSEPIELTPDEIELKNKFGLSDGQILWRRSKLIELGNDVNLFCQEYPSTDDEAFIQSGGNLFPERELELTLQESPYWGYNDDLSESSNCNVWTLSTHPRKEFKYVAGVDVAAGIGRDYSVVQILCVDTMEQVCVIETNRISPAQFAKVVADILSYYNFAYVVPERNSHGLSFIDVFTKIYPLNKIYTRVSIRGKDVQYGFETGARSRVLLVNKLRKALEKLKIYHFKTIMELREFGEISSQSYGSLSGKTDDHVISLALACSAIEQFTPQEYVKLEPVEARLFNKNDPSMWSVITFEDMISRLPSNRKGGKRWLY